MADQNPPTPPPTTPPSETQAPAPEPKTMFVKSTLADTPDGGSRVALWERDAAHPNGEAYIAGSMPVEVGMTPEVNRLLRDGVIVKTSAPKPPAADKPQASDKK